jgi:hypothetical protein
MDWPTSRLERDIARVGIAVVSIAGLVGAAAGWLASQVVTHLRDEGISGHFQGRPK